MKVYISNASIATMFVHIIITAYNTLTMNIQVSYIIQPEDFENRLNSSLPVYHGSTSLQMIINASSGS